MILVLPSLLIISLTASIFHHCSFSMYSLENKNIYNEFCKILNLPGNKRILKFLGVRTIFQLVIFFHEVSNSLEDYPLVVQSYAGAVVALCFTSHPYFMYCYILPKGCFNFISKFKRLGCGCLQSCNFFSR